MRTALLIALALLAPTVAPCATLYKCMVDGVPAYQDVPCPASAQSAEVLAKSAPPPIRGAELPVALRERWAAQLAQQKVAPGMTADVVRASWGAPTRTNTTLHTGGTRDQWVYRHGRSAVQYVHFRDGIVTSITTGR